jgi:hypothetical protein
MRVLVVDLSQFVSFSSVVRVLQSQEADNVG